MLWTRHGYNRTPDYKRWRHIKDRVFNPNCKDFINYGGRGITIHKLWKNNAGLFIDYIRSLPNYEVDGVTLDRVDNDGNYEPMNLRWASRETQISNRRSTGTAILQWSLEGELIGMYISICEASRQIGANQSNLGKVIDTHRTCKGFKWTKQT